jgi:hypothetical protein
MPKRKRSKEIRPSTTPTSATTAPASAGPKVDTEQERAARLFAESIRDHEAADVAARDRQASAARHEHQHDELVAAKEAAAARLRRLRGDGRPRQQMAEAEAGYRAALAALTEFETGERPHWAPAVATVGEVSDRDAEASDDTEESAADQPS